MAVTIQDIWQLFLQQGRKCTLTGMPLTLNSRGPAPDATGGRLVSARTASLDRIDSSKGYTLDNIQWVHKDVNRMKMELPESRFVELCTLVAEHAKSRTTSGS